MTLLQQTTGERRPSSVIAREETRDGAVYRKQYIAGDWDKSSQVVLQRAKREVGLLQRIADSGLFQGRLGVVKVVSAAPEDATVVTSEVAGVTLDVIVSQRFHRLFPFGQRAMNCAGRWLQQFQKLPTTASDHETFCVMDPTDLAEYCAIRIDGIVEYGQKPLSSSVRDRILHKIRSSVEQSEEADKNLVWSHADYSPGNIIWDGRVITPIDFAMAHVDRPLLDATYFLHRLEMQQLYRPWYRWPLDVWRRAFLAGYGRSNAEHSPMYQALMLRHLVCRLHTYSRRPPRNTKQRLHDKWVRNRIRAKLRQVSEL